jgi:uncharacterized membrane protein YhaH (DUF805 family)
MTSGVTLMTSGVTLITSGVTLMTSGVTLMTSGVTHMTYARKFILAVNILALILLSLLMFFLFVRFKEVYYYHRHYNEYTHDYETLEYYDYTHNWEAIYAFSIIFCVYILFIILPVLAATVRRLHDVGEPGEFIFVGLIPFFGTITLIVYLCKDSVVETNIYGKSPKYTQLDNSIDMTPLNPIINSDP